MHDYENAIELSEITRDGMPVGFCIWPGPGGDNSSLEPADVWENTSEKEVTMTFSIGLPLPGMGVDAKIPGRRKTNVIVTVAPGAKVSLPVSVRRAVHSEKCLAPGCKASRHCSEPRHARYGVEIVGGLGGGFLRRVDAPAGSVVHPALRDQPRFSVPSSLADLLIARAVSK